MTSLQAHVLCCTVKPSPAPFSLKFIGREVLAALADHDVDGDLVRVVDHHVRFGGTIDEGDGDEWPMIRAQLLTADILVLATPIWMGQPAIVCKMVL